MRYLVPAGFFALTSLTGLAASAWLTLYYRGHPHYWVGLWLGFAAFAPGVFLAVVFWQGWRVAKREGSSFSGIFNRPRF